MKILEVHVVPELDKAARLSEYAIGIFQSITTRNGIKKAIKKGLVHVNQKVGQTATFIYGGERIVLHEAVESKPIKLLEFPLEVLMEDEHLAVINKPAGIVVSGNMLRTIEHALPFNLQQSNQADALKKPQPIHRLDYPTSGVLLVGKTSSATIALNRMFEKKEVQKTYHAVTIGEMLHKQGEMKQAIAGKPSRSVFEVLASLPSERFGQLNLVRLDPKTGRRHQLRIHLAALGNPILGDKEYGQETLILRGKGLYLHASALTFQHPITKDLIQVEKELPKKFIKLFPSM